MSFTGSTKVLTASGLAVPIASLKPGEKVLATNIKMGKAGAEPIAAVLVHDDTDRYGAGAVGGHMWSEDKEERAARRAVPRGPTLGLVTLTVNLPGEVAAALEAEAARRGQAPDRVAADLLAERLPPPGARRRLAFAAVGASASGRHATDTDDMLAEGFGRDD